MNLAQMRERAKHRVREISGYLVRDQTWDEHLNVAYLEFIARSDFHLEIDHATVHVGSGQRRAELPAGSFRVLSVKDLTRGATLDDAGPWRNITRNYANLLEVGEPSQYKVIGRYLHLFPPPSATTQIEVLVFLEPPKLVQEADVPIIPERYHEALVSYAAALVFKDDHDWEAADRFERDFMELVEAAKLEFGSYPQAGYAVLPRAPR